MSTDTNNAWEPSFNALQNEYNILNSNIIILTGEIAALKKQIPIIKSSDTSKVKNNYLGYDLPAPAHAPTPAPQKCYPNKIEVTKCDKIYITEDCSKYYQKSTIDKTIYFPCYHESSAPTCSINEGPNYINKFTPNCPTGKWRKFI